MRDSELVASIVAGDPAGLAAAYDRYAGALFGYCRSLLREQADAADVVHDTFVVAAVSLDQLRDRDRLRPWLYAVARNLALRQLRAGKAAAVYPAVVPDGDIEDITDFGTDAERAELRALLHAATGGLSPRARDMIELRLWQGLDTAETATVMGISGAHANSLLYRARNQLTAAVGVLLVARAGPGDCAPLKGILSGWDGHLTVPLRKRLSRHIGHCRTCSDQRNSLLPPLLTLWPAGTLAAAVAGEQARHAAAVPAGLKDQVLRAAGAARDAGGGAGKASATGAAARGLFGKNGFPHRRLRLRTVTTCAAAGAAMALLTLALVARAHPTMIYLGPSGGGPPGISPASQPSGGGPASPGGVPGQGGHGGIGPTPVITVVPVAASSSAGLPVTSAGPATGPPTTAPPSSAPPTTVPPTTAPPTTAPPTTAPPTTAPPTTAPPTTAPPTTAPPTTAPPTTPPPTTPPPTTAPPTTPPPTTPPPTTAPPPPPTTPPVTGTVTASRAAIALTPLRG